MNAEEETTGFVQWCSRQPSRSEAGKLYERLSRDLGDRPRSEWPRTSGEVTTWALALQSAPPRLAQWLTAAHVGWRAWLATVRRADSTEETAARQAEALKDSGRPTDNPFAKRVDA